MPLNPGDTIQQSPQVFAADVGQDVVVMANHTGLYVALDEIGAVIWKKLAQPLTVTELEQQLTAEYDAPAATIQADLSETLTKLAEAGIIEVSP